MRTRFILLLTFITHVAFGQVQSYTLDNGLKVLVKEDHRAPVAVTMIWYNVGSADEPGGLTGISHALEHIMFKGTTKYPLGVFSKTIAGIGGQENAFTSTDYTAYFEKIAAEHLPTSLALEADRMQHLLLDETEFNKEIKVIQEERRMRTDDNPQALTFERYLSAAHLISPYHHPVIGWMDDIQHLSIAELKTWYQRFYAPNNATLVVVGDVKPEDVYALAQQHFGAIPKSETIERKPQIEPPELGKKTITVKAPAEIPVIMHGYTVPTVKSANKEHADDPYTLEVIAAILDAGGSSRFSKNLIRGTQRASSIGTDYNLYARYPSLFTVYGTPSTQHTLDDLSQDIDTELKHLKTTRVTAAELKRVQTQLIAQKTFERDSGFGQAMELGMLETVGLGWKTTEQYEQHIRAVTPADIQAVANRYFDEDRLTEARLVPQKISQAMQQPAPQPGATQ